MSDNKRKEYTTNDNLMLYSQVEGVCPLCTKVLITKKNTQNYKLYEIAHIYPLNPTKIELELLKDEERLSEDPNDLRNVICLCVACHTLYDKQKTVEEYRELITIKRKLLAQDYQKSLWERSKIHEDIIQLIEALYAAQPDGEASDILDYDPKQIDDKVDDTITKLTKRKMHRNVQDYFHIVRSKFSELDAITPTTTELISSQIKTHYLWLKSEKSHDQNEIFKALVQWITKTANLSNIEAAEVLVSYFVQNCEVFE